MSSKSDKHSSNLIIRLTGTLISIFLLIFLLYKQGWSEIITNLEKIAWWEVLLSLGFILISRLATAARWHLILKALNIKIPLKDSLSLTFAGLFAANFLPSTIGGDIARLAGTMQMKYDTARCAASLILDRLTGMLGMLMIMPFGIPFFAKLLRPSNLHQTPAMLLLARMTADPEKVISNGISARLRRAFRKTLSALGEGIRRPGYLIGALGFTWVHMIGYFTAIAIILAGMKDPLPYLVIAEGWTIIYFLTLLPISINGLGLQELSITCVYTRAGISPVSAIAAALLIRTFTVIASLPGAAFVPSILAGVRRLPPSEN